MAPVGDGMAKHAPDVSEDVKRERSDPDDEARLVQAEHGSPSGAEHEERDAGPEKRQGRGDEHRCHEHA